MYVEILKCGSANAYLIHGEHASVLFDTGTRKYRDMLLDKCRDAKVKLILISHGHFDHCQNASYLAEKLNCLVGVSKADAVMLENGTKIPVYGDGIWGMFYACASNLNIQKNKIEATHVDILIENEISLRDYGINGKVVNLPGHTVGSIGILLDTNELFVGDAMQNIISAKETWCYENRKQSKMTVCKIGAMNAKVIYYGHGKPSYNR